MKSRLREKSVALVLGTRVWGYERSVHMFALDGCVGI